MLDGQVDGTIDDVHARARHRGQPDQAARSQTLREDAGYTVTMAANGTDVIRLVVFVLDERRYALPLGAVEHVHSMVDVSPLPEAPAIVLGVVNLHGAPIAVVDLRRRFGLAACDYGVSGHLLVARTPRRALAMPVDEVLGVIEVERDRVTVPSEMLPGVGHVAGIVALDDGLLLIQDLDAVLALREEQELGRALGKMTA